MLTVTVTVTVIPVIVSAEGGNEVEYLETKDYYEKIIEKEIKFISSLAFKNGAIGMFAPSVSSYSDVTLPTVDGISPDEYRSWPSAKVVPYFSDSAVMGVIKGSEALGNTDGKDTALNYINWYISHMNTAESDINGVAGTVYDYFIFQNYDGRIVEVKLYDAYSSKYPSNNPYDYDSTDSYAAMFLEILYEYTRVFDGNFLDDKKDVVGTLVDVIMSTYVPAIDLTYAKPTYAVCYLMDNCEVYLGFEAAAKIYDEFLNDDEKRDYCHTYADKVKNALLTTMWSDEYSCFKAAVFTDGKPAGELNLAEFYPQASCQLFPLLFGVIDAADEKAETVYARFKNDFCQEGVSGHDWSAYDLDGLTYPWCILVQAAVEMGDFRIAQKYISVIYSRFIKTGHNYPYYNAEAGWILISSSYLYGLAAEPAEESSEEEASTPENTTEEESETSSAAVSESSVPTVNKSKGVSPWIYAGAGVAIAAAAAVIIYLIGKKDKKKG